MRVVIFDVLGYSQDGIHLGISQMEPDGDETLANWQHHAPPEGHSLAVPFESDSQTLANIRATGFFRVNFKQVDRDTSDLKGTRGEPALRPTNARKVMASIRCKATDFVPVGEQTFVIGELTDRGLTPTRNPGKPPRAGVLEARTNGRRRPVESLRVVAEDEKRVAHCEEGVELESQLARFF